MVCSLDVKEGRVQEEQEENTVTFRPVKQKRCFVLKKTEGGKGVTKKRDLENLNAHNKQNSKKVANRRKKR